MQRVVIVGAGIGGLTTAAVLARAGVAVTVLEAHIYPGGCAGTFYHQKYRFDAGATLAGGFYPGGPMDLVAREAGVKQWHAQRDDLAMVVHLPGHEPVYRWSDERRWAERQRAFGDSGLSFFQWQESIADPVWELALKGLPWPPQGIKDLATLSNNGMRWAFNPGVLNKLPALLKAAASVMQSYLDGADDALRLFIDAQLLISAQTTSAAANALYGAAALDLPRRGIAHLEGGMGAIAKSLVDAIHAHGGEVLYRREVTQVVPSGQRFCVRTRRGDPVLADTVIFNLPPWNIQALLKGSHNRRLRNLPPMPQDGWGAAMLYAGVDGHALPADSPLHHQVILAEPLGEGNSVYISISPAWDSSRAPKDKRAVTFSTHTNLQKWWHLYATDRPAYEHQKENLTQRMIQAAELVLPGFSQAVELTLPGTPVTFERFTRRKWGWVGGFPQTNLVRAWGPHIADGLWMVGDSIFPGQSTASVALGGLRVARAVLGRAPTKIKVIEPVGSESVRLGDGKVEHVNI